VGGYVEPDEDELRAIYADTATIAVVGASLGGLRAAEQLRAAGWEDEITVLGAEPHPPYQRPPLSKKFLAEPSRPDSLLLRAPSFWRERASPLVDRF
jgi:3-phenylpropionate/trans-cinnamate dioxygenase ferredoxin reductase component